MKESKLTRKDSAFFFEKKKQKTFVCFDVAGLPLVAMLSRTEINND
jgi:hypothetical protein